MTNEELTSMLKNVSRKDIENLLRYHRVQEAESHALAKAKSFNEIIEMYLTKMAELDPQLAEKFPNNPAGKTVKDCVEYINNQARKMVTNQTGTQCVALSNAEVYNLAVQYFLDDSIEKVEKKEPVRKPAPKPAKRTLAQLQKAKEEWQKENDRQVQEWEIAHNARIDKFENEHKLDLFPPENPYLKEVNPFLDKTFPDQEELDKLLAEKDNPAPEPDNSPGEDNPEEINPEEIPENETDQETEDEDD